MKKSSLLLIVMFSTFFLKSQNIEYIKGLEWDMNKEQVIELRNKDSLKISFADYTRNSLSQGDTTFREDLTVVDSGFYKTITTYSFRSDSLFSINFKINHFKSDKIALERLNELISETSQLYGKPVMDDDLVKYNTLNDLQNFIDLLNHKALGEYNIARYHKIIISWCSKGEYIYLNVELKDDIINISYRISSISYEIMSSITLNRRVFGKVKTIAFDLAFDYSTKTDIKNTFLKEGGEIIEKNEIVFIPDNLNFAGHKAELVMADFYKEYGFYQLTILLESSEYTIYNDFYQLVDLYKKKYSDESMNSKRNGYGVNEKYVEPYFKGDGFFPQALRLKAATLSAKYHEFFKTQVVIVATFLDGNYSIIVEYQNDRHVDEIQKRKEKELIDEL